MTLGTIRVADKVSIQQFPNGWNKIGTVVGVAYGIITVECGGAELKFKAINGEEVDRTHPRKGHRLIAKAFEESEYTENYGRRP